MHYNTHIYMNLFFHPEEIGSHLIRRGTATYCRAGAHPDPPIVSVCLRAGWTIGRVKERYLKYENAGHELVGRTLTGILPTSCEFGISPVLFLIFTNICKPSWRICMSCITYSTFKILSHILLSRTFIHHENWTVQATSQTCPLKSSLCFSFTEKYPNGLSFVKTSLLAMKKWYWLSCTHRNTNTL